MIDALPSGRAAIRDPAPGASPELRRFALFLAVGSVGLAVDCAVFSGLLEACAPSAGARAASLVVATGATWLLNRTVTFPSATGSRTREALRYAAVTLIAQGFSFGVFLALTAALPRLAPVLALAMSAAAAAALSFAGQRLFTFRPA